MSLKLPQLLALSEKARTNPDLIQNHLGTVDRKLREHLADCEQVLTAIEGSGDAEFEKELREKQRAITTALTAYAHGVTGTIHQVPRPSDADDMES